MTAESIAQRAEGHSAQGEGSNAMRHALCSMRLSIMIQLRDNQRCYVCGKENPAGLGVNFEIDRERRAISAKFTPSKIYQGYEGIVHGGILSTLLDEAMAKLTVSLGIPAVTAEITVSFKAPAAPGEELLISGRITHEARRLVQAEARIERGPVLIAEATGKLLRISTEYKVQSTE